MSTAHSNTLALAGPVMWWDGGDRAITAREKALIEEHGPSSFSIPLVQATALQPAGLAGQQGVAFVTDAMVDAACKILHHGYDHESRKAYREACQKAARQALEAALAAPPSSAGQGAVPCATSASHALRVAYRHLDMVSMRVSHCKDAAIIESAMKDVDTFDLNGAISALADRQPGSQEPVGMMTACGFIAYTGFDELPVGTQFYAAPPAQGIDLGRALDIMWNWQEQLGGHVFDARDVARTLTSSDMQAIGVDARACIDATNRNQAIVLAKREIVRALSSDQRDAAPGVGNG